MEVDQRRFETNPICGDRVHDGKHSKEILKKFKLVKIEKEIKLKRESQSRSNKEKPEESLGSPLVGPTLALGVPHWSSYYPHEISIC